MPSRRTTQSGATSTAMVTAITTMSSDSMEVNGRIVMAMAMVTMQTAPMLMLSRTIPTRWSDSDEDGIADEDDDFANDPTQSLDSDNDGYGDNANGTSPDAFPNDPNRMARW